MSKDFQYNKGPLDAVEASSPRDFALSTHEFGVFGDAETTQRFVYGTRYITWDGRVYKYMGLTTGGCVSYHGVANTLAAVTGFTTAVAGSIGDTEYVITDTGITEDQLAGGMITLYKATIDNTTNRHIVGNDATSGTTTRLYLEAGLSAAITASDAVEVFENPYRLVSESTIQSAAWMGIPNVTAATGYNVWTQTWGPALVSPGNQSLDDPAANERSVYWWNNGTIAEAASAQATSESQHAGYILNEGSSGIAGPQIYLMCST
jgi:hypothetical protein